MSLVPIADRTRNTATGTPSSERLHAAVTMVIEKLHPDQIILFGSAARNEMSERSDLDLLVIKEHGDRNSPVPHDHWTCPTTGDQLDVIVMDRATAERHRQSASHLQGAALEEGRTLYVRNGSTPAQTGPTYTWDGKQMVRSTRFEPDHSNELLEQAERKWNTANREDHPVDKCEYLQESMERVFKALITAEGRRVQHTHELDDLWKQAEANGEQIRAIRNPEQLDKLSRYAGSWRYALPTDENPSNTWTQNRVTGKDLLNHARTRIPELIQETRKHLSTTKSRVPTGDPSRDPQPASETDSPPLKPAGGNAADPPAPPGPARGYADSVERKRNNPSRTR